MKENVFISRGVTDTPPQSRDAVRRDARPCVSTTATRLIRLITLIALITVKTMAVQAQGTASVNNLDNLLAEIASAPTDGMEKVITLTAKIMLVNSENVTLQGPAGSSVKILRGVSDHLFTLGGGTKTLLAMQRFKLEHGDDDHQLRAYGAGIKLKDGVFYCIPGLIYRKKQMV